MKTLQSAVIGFAALFCLAGCISATLPKPRLPKLSKPKLPKLSKPKLPDFSSVVGANTVGSGSLEFVGFTPEALADFQVITSEGGELITPSNSRYNKVEGFWWRQQKALWFRVPGRCHATITAAQDAVISSAFTVSHDCNRMDTRIQKLRGQQIIPRFVPDRGETVNATDYPFDAEVKATEPAPLGEE